MHRTVLLIGQAALLSSVLVLSACDSGHIERSGVSATEAVPVASFSAIDIAGAGDVTVIVGPEASVTVTADSAVLPKLRTGVSGGTLHLDGLKRDDGSAGDVSYLVTVPGLDYLALSGEGDVKLEGIAAPNLTVLLTGAGDITLAGAADSAIITVEGAGNLRAGGLVTRAMSVTISGVGDAAVWATELLRVAISGIGDVTYTGSPAITSTIDGTGTVTAAR